MKRILIMAVGLLIVSAANAQNKNDNSIKFGIKAGVNLSNIIKTDDPNFTTDYKTGFNAGITLNIPLIERLSFAPEVLYSTKGYKAKTVFGNFTQTTNFLEIPILAKIGVAGGFSLVAGPQVSFLLSTNNKFDNGFVIAEQQINEDSKKFKKSLVGGVIGATFDINPNIDIHGRYAIDFQKNNEDGTSQTPKYRNQVFQIGIGFKF